MSVRLLYLFVASLVCCAPAGTPGTGSGGGLPHNSNVINSDEVMNFNPEGKTAFDLVSRLRPKWLVARGAVAFLPADNADSTEYAMVFVDGNPMGKLSALHDIPALHVDDIRFYDVAEAGARFGTRGGRSGVIEVRQKDRTSR